MTGRPLGVVTGASSGIGWAFAQSLAARGHDLAAGGARARTACASWRRLVAERHGVEARVVVADLATDEGLAACREAITAEPEPPEVVVLNAGFGSRGRLWELERERQSAMVRLNCLAVVDLAAHVLPGMVARGSGRAGGGQLRGGLAAGSLHGHLRGDEGLRAAPGGGHGGGAARHRRAGARDLPGAHAHRVHA